MEKKNKKRRNRDDDEAPSVNLPTTPRRTANSKSPKKKGGIVTSKGSRRAGNGGAAIVEIGKKSPKKGKKGGPKRKNSIKRKNSLKRKNSGKRHHKNKKRGLCNPRKKVKRIWTWVLAVTLVVCFVIYAFIPDSCNYTFSDSTCNYRYNSAADCEEAIGGDFSNLNNAQVCSCSEPTENSTNLFCHEKGTPASALSFLIIGAGCFLILVILKLYWTYSGKHGCCRKKKKGSEDKKHHHHHHHHHHSSSPKNANHKLKRANTQRKNGPGLEHFSPEARKAYAKDKDANLDEFLLAIASNSPKSKGGKGNGSKKKGGKSSSKSPKSKSGGKSSSKKSSKSSKGARSKRAASGDKNSLELTASEIEMQTR